MTLVPLLDLKFLQEFAAGTSIGGTSIDRILTSTGDGY
jgi:hypothetical protein